MICLEKRGNFRGYVELAGYVVNTYEPQKPRLTADLVPMPVGTVNRSSSLMKHKLEPQNCNFQQEIIFPYLFNICEPIS